ncbi:unnamed protein product [Urochloa humidicola]
MWCEKILSQRDTKATNEADTSLKPEVSTGGISKGVALTVVRGKFFPFWKSVLSARLVVNVAPFSQPNSKVKSTKASKSSSKGTKTTEWKGKDMEVTEPTGKDIQNDGLPWFASKLIKNRILYGCPPSANNSQFTRQFCTAASMTLKGLRRI